MSLQTDGNTIDCYSIANVPLLLNIVTQKVIIVITVIIFICYHLHTEYLKLHTRSEPCFGVQNVAAILQLQFMVHVMLYSMINVFYFAVELSEVSPQRPTRLFSVVPSCHNFQVCYSGIFFIFETVQLLLLELAPQLLLLLLLSAVLFVCFYFCNLCCIYFVPVFKLAIAILNLHFNK